ncbi:hypothetical protein UFOVP730_9 [uncultured Caudovirales phage]|uniref:Uncharacterized protein n=1 Tax=uncultured Caudovirales phage TaxID=2100421 RepID=A0A6J5NLN3_9CAUD|nr:hypothetical protein UFOVP730_9 [uncultured Caudovirales phage]
MTKEELVIIGRQAESLLATPAFDQAIKQFRENLADKFFQSKPEDNSERERIYNLRLCLDAVIGNLQSFIMAKQSIEAEQELEQS